MDTQKIGKFLKDLRKQNNMTQEQLGERIGVTNKTISRWETGNYMPPIESLRLLSDIYEVSINEILAGERLSQEHFKEAAEENIATALKKMNAEEKKFENIMILIMAATSILAIIIMLLLPGADGLSKTEKVKELLVIICVWAMAILANTLNLVALVTKKSINR
ncbi:MAG: helix-turn-helix transcriptional regulator [Lachnospiraceae bacterium]|nr:helix-turn-helix transcriptional regulator [Lachnospiraceae bacterium]